jgi:hypothetical protein
MSQHFKVYLLAVALAYAPLLLFAQDTLITFSGDTSLVLIEEYDEEEVVFRRLNSRESLRQLGMRFVSQILYQDQQNNSKWQPEPKYKPGNWLRGLWWKMVKSAVLVSQWTVSGQSKDFPSYRKFAH